MCLTTDTSDALFVTLKGMVAIIKVFLSKGFKYVLHGTFQSDRQEGEFGVFRKSAGGCYYISFQQVVNSLALQRKKHFDQLEMEKNSILVKIEWCPAEPNGVRLNRMVSG